MWKGYEEYWSLTSIKPKNKRLWVRILSSLNEPVEKGPPRIFINSYVPRIVWKAHVKVLSWELKNPVQLLLDKWVNWRGCNSNTQMDKDEYGQDSVNKAKGPSGIGHFFHCKMSMIFGTRTIIKEWNGSHYSAWLCWKQQAKLGWLC